MRSWIAVLSLALLLPAAAAQALDVMQIAIDRGVGQPGGTGIWFVEISVVGDDVQAGVLTSSTGFDIELTPLAGTSDQLFGAAIFEDQSSLDAAFPLGTWALNLNAGELEGDIAYDSPVVADGPVEILTPVFGASGIPLEPTFTFQNECTNCQVYSLGSPVDSMGNPFPDTPLVGRLRNLDSGEPVEEFFGSQSTTEFSPEEPLEPNTSYRFAASVATQNYTPTSIDGDSFDYFQIWSDTETTIFSTVPEPGTGVLVGLGLALIAARRRR